MTHDSPIPIDLRDLTDKRIAEAMPHMGECRYDAPCIIGTLIPVADRTALSGGALHILIREGRLSIPPDQQAQAIRLQRAFDSWPTSKGRVRLTAIIAEIRNLSKETGT